MVGDIERASGMIIFGTRQLVAIIQMSAGVSVAGTVVHFAEAVKLLGVTMDPVLINM